jgi:hypothetical protein
MVGEIEEMSATRSGALAELSFASVCQVSKEIYYRCKRALIPK